MPEFELERAPYGTERTPEEAAVIIDILMSDQGGWSKHTLECFGVPWPPIAGWRKGLAEGRLSLPDDGHLYAELNCRLWVMKEYGIVHFWRGELAQFLVAEGLAFADEVTPESAKDVIYGWAKMQEVQHLRVVSESIEERRKANRRPKGGGFYKSWEWKKLRYEVLNFYGAKCMLCGSEERIVVDHIYPRKKFPDLELEFDNMQVLCNNCNMGKSNDDYTDHRPKDRKRR